MSTPSLFQYLPLCGRRMVRIFSMIRRWRLLISFSFGLVCVVDRRLTISAMVSFSVSMHTGANTVQSDLWNPPLMHSNQSAFVLPARVLACGATRGASLPISSETPTSSGSTAAMETGKTSSGFRCHAVLMTHVCRRARKRAFARTVQAENAATWHFRCNHRPPTVIDFERYPCIGLSERFTQPRRRCSHVGLRYPWRASTPIGVSRSNAALPLHISQLSAEVHGSEHDEAPSPRAHRRYFVSLRLVGLLNRLCVNWVIVQSGPMRARFTAARAPLLTPAI